MVREVNPCFVNHPKSITNILETVFKDVVRPALEEVENGLQRGFNKNSAPMNCSRILEEVIRESNNLRQLHNA